MRFVIQRMDEEVHFLIDGEEVGYTNHDLSGWAGMEIAEDLFTNIANKLGIEVEKEDRVDEED